MAMMASTKRKVEENPFVKRERRGTCEVGNGDVNSVNERGGENLRRRGANRPNKGVNSRKIGI